MTNTSTAIPPIAELVYSMPVAPTIYQPRKPVPVASSFEGVVNDGAPECGLVSLNAYPNFFGTSIEMQDFPRWKEGYVMRAFLKLRPLVETASDYRVVLKMIYDHEREARALVEDGAPQAAYRFFIDRFKDAEAEIGEAELIAFGGSKEPKIEGRFYAERKRLQAFDYDAWLGLQSLMPGAIPQFRALHDTAEYAGPESSRVVRGFVPWFATAKDEASTFALCQFYSAMGELRPEDVLGERCVIPRRRVLGKDRTTKKKEQLNHVAEQEDVPTENVFYVNDRFDKNHVELREAGFPHQFIVTGGYAFPWEYDEARDAGIVVVERQSMAKTLGEYAKEKGF